MDQVAAMLKDVTQQGFLSFDHETNGFVKEGMRVEFILFGFFMVVFFVWGRTAQNGCTVSVGLFHSYLLIDKK